MAFAEKSSLPAGQVRCLRRFVLLLVVAALASGCQNRQRARVMGRMPIPTPRVQMLQKPAIDLSRGVAGFPLQAENPPRTPQLLVAAMTEAYRARLEGSPSLDIQALGSSLKRLQLLQIDLTGSSVRSTYVPKDQAQEQFARPYILADRLRYVANPLKYHDYSASLVVEASKAELTLIPTTDHQWTLVLSDCDEGSAHIRVGLEDLRRGALAAAKARQSVAFGINDLSLDITSPSSRVLEARVLVKSRVFFVPSAFTISGRVRIDNQFNVHFSRLSAQGSDPSGAMIAGFVQGKLDKFNNKAAPLLKLPGGKIRLTDLRFNVDDKLGIDVQFAGTGR
ncbi:MAG TPA: hypothetical protein VGB55_13845 [Tepidisphaeraceae bacterium]